ncbi:bifunctional YncE family protein/alkaline phosphatase family protein [Geothrix sp. 21YS21S-2]|uniref:bifunctional YncE family protein/alkaline phosphatase family protein n=1 Tax=Geothrix sp. 21YS21S-2 TaxID=3068893 RepID=UPI0027BAE959|nr:bifunctional YncE family protein/alkaline phosphatase family protein [Geothrix sp. 21YS21S-2]
MPKRLALSLALSLAALWAGEPPVGARGARGVRVATGQWVEPAGDVLTFPGRAIDMALSEDGATLFVKTDRGLLVVDTGGWRVRQSLAWGRGDSASMHGLAVDGGRVWVTTGKAGLLEAAPGAAGVWAWGRRIALAARDGKSAYPCGVALAGTRAVVALGRENAVAVLDLAAGSELARIPVGVAPCGVALSADGSTAFVANWGGRRPAPGQRTMASAGSPVAVDEGDRPLAGTVSRVDLARGAVTGEAEVGLHPCQVLLEGGTLSVANANSDSVTVLAAADLRVIRTVPVTPDPGLPFGSIVNALALDPRDGTLFAASGGTNAVGVIRGGACAGFVPAGWFPSCVAAGNGRLYIGSARGLGSREGRPGAKGWSVRSEQGTLQRVAIPADGALRTLTRRATDLAQVPRSLEAMLPARKGSRGPVPVPRRAGEPSVFRHVVYVIKENRTYDQVFGDLPQGDGDPSLCIYPREVTPNHHALAEQFVLLDNYYCNGVVSADGHQWATQGITTAYTEKTAGDWTRSYDLGTDPLAFAPTPFLWDSALLRGRSFRNFGEFDFTTLEPPLATWQDVYADHLGGTRKVGFRPSMPTESLRRHTAPDYPGWNTRIPDVVRVERFLAEFRECERKGAWQDLVVVYLPQDHTRGLTPGAPTPRAHLADNDLALGRLVEAISHSRFWKDTCIFVNEDDPQDGFDHVDGHRSLCLVVSPYTLRGRVVSRFYNQGSVLHTMERMLGLPPMTRLDGAAPTMEGCFTRRPDFTPYTALPSRVPLDEVNPRRTGALLDFSRPDTVPDDELNRLLWFAARGDAPYPAWFAGAHGKGLARKGLGLGK